MAAAAPDSSLDALLEEHRAQRVLVPAGLNGELSTPSMLSPQRGSAGTGEETESLTQGSTGRGGGASQFQEETWRNQEIRSPVPAAGQETSGRHVFVSVKTSRFPLRRHRGERLGYL